MTKILKGLILIAITTLITCNCYAFSRSELHAALVKQAAELNKQMPLRIDSVTVEKYIEVQDLTLITHTVITQDVPLDQRNYVRLLLEGQQINILCKDQAVLDCMKSGMDVKYVYDDKIGRFLFETVINIYDCVK